MVTTELKDEMRIPPGQRATDPGRLRLARKTSGNPLRIDIVSVCVDYADFLRETLPTWLLLRADIPGRTVVVTSLKDGETAALCQDYGVECLRTNAVYESDCAFNKSAALNRGLAELDHDSWILTLDADIALPPWASHALLGLDLFPGCLYGADRLLVHSSTAWDRVRRLSSPSIVDNRWLILRDAEFGDRFVTDALGWLPLGYFQLWHPACGTAYPEQSSGGAEASDIRHAANWPQHRRELLPNLYVYHLESESSKIGANWNGRRTRPFRD